MRPPKKENDLDSSGQAKQFSDEITIPVSIFSDRSIASLEAVVEYMKDVLKLSYHEIAVHLHRDDRTIWTCYNRVQKKRLNSSSEKSDKAHQRKEVRRSG